MGIPMLWMGEEFAEPKRKSQTVTQPKKIAWSLLEKPLNRDLFEHYQKLIALRQQYTAVSSDNIEFLHEDATAKVLAYSRESAKSERVLVVANFSDKALSQYQIPNLPEAEWQEWISGEISGSNQEILINLPEYEAKIFVETKKL